jgi:hypothetical protein
MVGEEGKLHTFFIYEKGRTGGFVSPTHHIQKNPHHLKGDGYFSGGRFVNT